MKMRIALWTSPGCELDMYSLLLSDETGKHTSRIRRTEYVEVEFKELAREETVRRELDALAEMEKAVLVDTNQKLQAIKDQRQKLLAITDQREVA